MLQIMRGVGASGMHGQWIIEYLRANISGVVVRLTLMGLWYSFQKFWSNMVGLCGSGGR